MAKKSYEQKKKELASKGMRMNVTQHAQNSMNAIPKSLHRK